MLNDTPQPWWGAVTSDQQSLERLKDTAPTRWRVPADISIIDNKLVYWADAFTVRVHRRVSAPFKVVRNPGIRVLTDFVGLAKASEQEIRSYARRWGVLGVCLHKFPPTSCPHAEYLKERHGRFCPPQGYPWRCSEPLSIWRALARWAEALLNGMAMLGRKQSITPDVWGILTAGTELTQELPSEMTRLEQWRFLGLCLNSWLEIISFRPGLSIRQDERAEFGLSISQHDFSQLLAVIGLELLFQVTGAKRLLTCSSCGRPYIPKRLPTRGGGTYCSTCGIRAARRDAATRWRKLNPDYFRRRRSKALKESPSKLRFSVID
jgi:hypothetical protein